MVAAFKEVISFVVYLFVLPLIIVPFVGPIVFMLVDQAMTPTRRW